MTAKKVYVVNVRLNFDMFVLAASKEDARSVARTHVIDELDNWQPRLGNPVECDLKTHAREDSRPYGADSIFDADKTVAELLAEQVEAARIEANQLKLPIGGGQ